ncbi:MAG: ABC transporter ATP-binding protein [Ardenticatenales bacterium]|jgi:branched-chain amino acid transport system ATP-binding protein|nr:ABC transporter ATP-binding protein [Ardenticatenales bacterium]
MALLEVHDVHSHYGNIHALKGVSLTVDEGEIVTLIGANGAGKSTTLRTISGLIRPSAGSVRLGGRDIAALKPHAIVAEGVVHVPEGRGIFARLTVDENLAIGAFIRSDTAGIAADLERVFESFPRLKERRRQAGGTLSGGEQQMLAIGRGLMARPRVLLLDEPSMGLAPILVEEIFTIIRRLNDEEGTTILLVEQNALAALDVADRGYVLETGTIRLSGPAGDLKRDPAVIEAYLGV